MQKWAEEGDDSLWLFTIDEFHKLPDGIELESISGKRTIKGIDRIDQDTRFNYMAFGVRNPFNHKHKDLFLLFALGK